MEERIYRNIWKEIGISDAQVEERLSQLISTFFTMKKNGCISLWGMIWRILKIQEIMMHVQRACLME